MARPPKFTDEQIQELRDLKINKKMTIPEISDIFTQKYSLTVNHNDVYRFAHDETKRRVKTPPGTRRAHRKRIKIGGGSKVSVKEPAATPSDSVKALIDQLFTELNAYSDFVIKKVRKELVKAVAAARQKRIDVGETVEAIKDDNDL